MMDTARQTRIAIRRATARAGATSRPTLAGPVVAQAAVGVALIVSGWLAPAALQAHTDGPVYTVAQVRAALWRSSPPFGGQTVWVRGVLQSGVTYPCAFTGGPCARMEIRLTEPGAETATGLPVVLEPAGPLATWLRRLPLVGALSAPQALQWGAIGRYHVRVQVRRVSGRAAGVTLIAADVDLHNP